jgi:calmodulin
MSNKFNANTMKENLKYCQIKELFEVFDKDNDGFIQIKEMATIMRSLGQTVSEGEMNEIYRVYDKDDSGKIEFSDFFHLVQHKYKDLPSEEDLIEAFKTSDKDSLGVLSTDELLHLMGSSVEKMSKDEIDYFLRMADTRGDGLINYDEYVKMMMSK